MNTKLLPMNTYIFLGGLKGNTYGKKSEKAISQIFQRQIVKRLVVTKMSNKIYQQMIGKIGIKNEGPISFQKNKLQFLNFQVKQKEKVTIEFSLKETW